MTDQAIQQSHQQQLYRIADQLIPGAGVGSYALSQDIRFIFSHGQGSRIWDTDDNEYIDYVGGAGALILGHSHAAVVTASQQQMARGAHIFGTLNDVAITLAARLVKDIPCAEKIAFATTGSEATAYAMRLARAHTGRDKILKFEGAYHGNHDYALVSTFPQQTGDYPQGVADSCGQPEATSSTMLVCPYNDLKTLKAIITEHGRDIAAIIAEAVQRIIPAEPEFLHGVRKLCDENDIVFILDEVVTGFRLGYGGAQAWYGVKPDLSTHGKVIGAGGPLSCIAGRADILDLCDPNRKGQPGYTYFNGTLHGNPVAAAATLAMLDALSEPGVYDRLNQFTSELCRDTQSVLKRHSIAAIAQNTGSLWQILFMHKPPRQYADILNSDQASMRRLDTLLIQQGQYLLPGVRRFVSSAHNEQDAEDSLAALDAACRAFKKSV